MATTAPTDDAGAVRDRAQRLAAGWLQGYQSAHTRNAYALAIGLPPWLRAKIKDGPQNPKATPDHSWIPWCLARGFDPAGDLTKQQVQAWLHTLSVPFPKKNVRRQKFAALCAFYEHLRSEQITTSNPNDLVKRKTMGLSGADPTSTLALDVHQIRALFTAARLDSTAHRERNVAIVAVLAATACRVEELVNLDLDSYRKHSNGAATLRLDGKGDKQRWQLLPAADCALVDAYLAVRVAPQVGSELTVAGQVSNRPTRSQPLFTTRRGERMNEDVIAPLLQRLAHIPTADDPRQRVREAERHLRPIKDKLRPHQFRHAYAVTAENQGKPVSQVTKDLGHASLATTQTYLDSANVGRNSAAQVVSDIYHAGETRDESEESI